MQLILKNLSIQFDTTLGPVKAVEQLSITLRQGETLGIVGESGSGKSTVGLSIIGLLAKNAKVTGSIRYIRANEQPSEKDEPQAIIPGKEVAMVFQEPMTALNPIMTCGEQVLEAVLEHNQISKQAAKIKIEELLQQVQLTDLKRICKAYPHQLSGGQKQRIIIAMALAARPSVLIADEPTTALDATIQKEVLALLKNLKKEYQLSVIFISHDLGVIKHLADRVAVMRNGKLIEIGDVSSVFSHPKEVYTKGLLDCRPSQNLNLSKLPTLEIDADSIPTKQVKQRQDYLSKQPTLLKVNHLSVWYPAKKNLFGRTTDYVKAVDNISFKVKKGETLGVVGESGSGKSTLARTILGLEQATKGEVWYDQTLLSNLSTESRRQWSKRIQIIFQDPYSALNPTHPIGYSIMEPMKVHNLWNNKTTTKQKAIYLLELVGLGAEHFLRLPHEFSGGQRQRICIAKALALEPEFIICDECVSSLDVSVQAQIINLLISLREKLKLTYIFISHDLSIVRFISDRIMVMKEGKIVEIDEAENIYQQPKSEYTKKLIAAVID